MTEIYTRTWAIEGTAAGDATWLAEAVAGDNGVAVWEDGWVVIDEDAFNHLTTLGPDEDGVIEVATSGGLTMYAAGDPHRVVEAGPRGLGFGRVE